MIFRIGISFLVFQSVPSVKPLFTIAEQGFVDGLSLSGAGCPLLDKLLFFQLGNPYESVYLCCGFWRHAAHMSQWLQLPQQELFPAFLLLILPATISAATPARTSDTMIVPRFSASHFIIFRFLFFRPSWSEYPILHIF